MDMRYIITQAKGNYVTSISTTNPSQYTEIHLPMISTLHYDYTLNICSRKMFQNSKSYLLILRCHMFNGPACCQAGKVYNSSVRACVLPGGGKYTTPVSGPVCCQAGKVYNFSARSCVLPGGESIQLQCQVLCAARRGKYTTPVSGPVCCQAGESIQLQCQVLCAARRGKVYNFSARSCVLPGGESKQLQC